MEEVSVSLKIEDGKLTVDSKSGPKSGSVELLVEQSAARLVLTGTGSDRAEVELTGPELANFRTMVDAALSTLSLRDDEPAMGRDVLSSGYRPLHQFDDGFGIRFDESTLRGLDLLDEEGRIAGGSRQIQCTVLGNGTAILNLKGERTSDLSL